MSDLENKIREQEAIIGRLKATTQWQASRIKDLKDKTVVAKIPTEQSDWKNYSLVEFMAACEEEDFKTPDEGWLEHWAKGLAQLLTTQSHHYGDCTDKPVACNLCMAEWALKDYKEYIADPEKWLEENE